MFAAFLFHVDMNAVLSAPNVTSLEAGQQHLMHFLLVRNNKRYYITPSTFKRASIGVSVIFAFRNVRSVHVAKSASSTNGTSYLLLCL